MSPSWNERLIVQIGPNAVHAARMRIWPSGVALAEASIAIEGDKDAQPLDSRSAAASESSMGIALRDAINAVSGRGRSITIHLSDVFVTYFVLPWSQSLKGESDWARLAAIHAVRLLDMEATRLQVRVRTARRGAPRLACAVPRTVVEAIRAARPDQGHRIAEVAPHVISAFNAARPILDRHATEHRWILACEDDRVTIGITNAGRWVDIFKAWAAADPQALFAMIEQEALYRGIATPVRALVTPLPWIAAEESFTLPNGFQFQAIGALPSVGTTNEQSLPTARAA